MPMVTVPCLLVLPCLSNTQAAVAPDKASIGYHSFGVSMFHVVFHLQIGMQNNVQVYFIIIYSVIPRISYLRYSHKGAMQCLAGRNVTILVALKELDN